MLGAIIRDMVGSVYEFDNTKRTDFESAVRIAVSLGVDSYTLACITGGIAEAYYQHIPDSILPGDTHRMRNRRIQG